MTAGLMVLAMVFGTMAFVAIVVFANRHRACDPVGPRRSKPSSSDGFIPWMSGDSSVSDCASGDAGGSCGGDGGGGGGGGD